MKIRSIKPVCVLLSALMLLTAFSCLNGYALENESGEKSDSGTYEYKLDDAVTVQRSCAYMLELSDAEKELYDLNLDGSVTIGDATIIQMHLAGLINIYSDEYQSIRPTEEPSTGEPTTSEPSTEEPTTEEPASEEPTTEEPSTEEPATYEPYEEYVYFAETKIYMGINETYYLNIETNAEEYDIYTSDDEVLYITDDLELVPLSTGRTVITCVTANGLYTDCIVYVGLEAQELIMNTPAITVGVSESFDLNSFVVGSGRFAANRWFYSSDENIVVVDEMTGVFTAVGTGTATVTCELINGVTADCTVVVKELSPTVTLNTYSVTAGVGESLGFVSYAENGKAVLHRSYYSENENIVKIDRQSGIMAGQSVGTTRIYCELQNGFRVYADVKIMPAPTTVTLNATKATIKVGDVIYLKEFFNEGSYNTPYTITWTSSNRAVYIEKTSNYYATLRAKALGTSVVTVTTHNGKSASCTVTVSGSNTKCVDISSWQGGNVDFNKVKASGVNYVIMRAGFRNSADNQFVNNYNKAKAAGLKVGAYWFMRAQNVNEAKKEAESCINVLGGRHLDLPIYYDIEDENALANDSQATLTNMAITFCEALKAKGYKVGVYASGSVFAHNNKLNTDLLRQKGYSIWNAEWASSNTVVCDVWQYTDNGSVGGYDGAVDMSLIYNLYIAD